MLFKVNDRNGKFIQYVSCCMDEKYITDGSFAKTVISCLQNTKQAKLSVIVDCYVSSYWTFSPLKLTCYTQSHEFSMIEIPSTKRKESFNKRTNYWSSNLDDGNTLSMAYTSTMQYCNNVSTINLSGYDI